jgi:uncharacterized damage-inducible protein DinB
MMHIRSSALLLVLCAALAPAQVPSEITAPCSTLVCDVQTDWLRNNGMVALTASVMPEEKYGAKPTPEQQTFGERVLHVAEVNVLLMSSLGAKTPAPELNFKATKKAEILAVLRSAGEYGTAVLKEFKEAQLLERIKSPAIMVPFMGPEQSRLRIVYFAMQHTQDTYGQLVVYLRVSGLVPPLSRQP